MKTHRCLHAIAVVSAGAVTATLMAGFPASARPVSAAPSPADGLSCALTAGDTAVGAWGGILNDAAAALALSQVTGDAPTGCASGLGPAAGCAN